MKPVFFKNFPSNHQLHLYACIMPTLEDITEAEGRFEHTHEVQIMDLANSRTEYLSVDILSPQPLKLYLLVKEENKMAKEKRQHNLAWGYIDFKEIMKHCDPERLVHRKDTAQKLPVKWVKLPKDAGKGVELQVEVDL